MNPNTAESLQPVTPSIAWSNGLPVSAAGVVLIVDDVPDNLSVLHDALDEAGYEGFLTLELWLGDAPLDVVSKGIALLRSL